MIYKLELTPKSSGLVVVAHPDDETIWCGGLIIQNPQVNWTIIALTRASDADRAPKFKRVTKHLKAKGIIYNVDDEGKISEKQAAKDIAKVIKDLKIKTDFLLTHGVNGEYGHDRHITCHETILKLIKNKKIIVKNVLFFNYKKISKYKLTAKADSDLIIKLPNKIYQEKIKIMSDIYGFDKNGIDAGFCTQIEGYKLYK